MFLQGAAAKGETEWVALALRFGANVERRNERGETALGYACAYGHLNVVKLLLDAGAEVNALEKAPEDGFSMGALDACSGPAGHPEVAAYLVARGGKRSHESTGGV